MSKQVCFEEIRSERKKRESRSNDKTKVYDINILLEEEGKKVEEDGPSCNVLEKGKLTRGKRHINII